jgi:hypothetical protein
MKLDGQFAQCPAAVECPDADLSKIFDYLAPLQVATVKLGIYVCKT